MRDNSEGNKSFLIKTILFFGVVAMIFIGLAIFREMRAKKQIQNEIEKLQIEAEKIQRENILSQEKLAYLESKDYQEKEAKDKLSLQNADEKVVIIKPTVVKNEENKNENTERTQIKILDRENYLKWWDYFFKY